MPLRIDFGDELDDDAIKRVRRLFGLSRLDKPPTNDEIRKAIRGGDRPRTVEENLRAAVNTDSGVLYDSLDPLAKLLREKVGLPPEEETE